MHNVFTPEGWQPGGPVIEPARAMAEDDNLDPDWFNRPVEPKDEQ